MDNFKRFLSGPALYSKEALKYAQELGGIEFYLPTLDRISLPMRKNEIMIWQARPGMGKTTFWLALANLIGKNLPVHRAPIFVTRETIVEDIGIYLMSRISPYTTEQFYRMEVPQKEIRKYALMLADMNMHIIGRKALDWSSVDKPTGDLDLNIVYQNVNYLRDQGQDPAFIVLDYAQKFDPADSNWRDKGEQKVAHVLREVEHFCLTIGMPVVLLAQSRREVDKYDIPLPSLSDIQWSSEGEKIASRVYSMLRPAAVPKWNPDLPDGKFVDIRGKTYENGHNLMIIDKLKERGTKPHATVGLHFNPATLEIGELTTEDFNEMINMSDDEIAYRQAQMEIGL